MEVLVVKYFMNLITALACLTLTSPGYSQDKGNEQLVKELNELRAEIKSLKVEIERGKSADREQKSSN